MATHLVAALNLHSMLGVHCTGCAVQAGWGTKSASNPKFVSGPHSQLTDAECVKNQVRASHQLIILYRAFIGVELEASSAKLRRD
eukprot:6471503-Amphidinium_carterae.1